MFPKNLVLDEVLAPKSLDELLDRLDTTHRVEHERTTIESIEVRADGTVRTPAGEWRVTPDFLESAAGAIKTPLAYAYDISPELFCENFTRRRSETTAPVIISRVGDVATGLIVERRSRYRPACTADVLRAVRRSHDLEFRRASVSFAGVDVEWVRKGNIIEPTVGDVVEVGIALTNSESGGRQLKASAYSYRLVCANGAIMADDVGIARWPNDPRMTVEGCLRAFQESLASLCSKLGPVLELYRVAIGRHIPATELWTLRRRVAHHLPRAAADDVLGISESERRDLQQLMRDREPGSAALNSQFTAYDVHNRITHAAHGQKFHIRRGLQEIGGELLSRAAAWMPHFSAN